MKNQFNNKKVLLVKVPKLIDNSVSKFTAFFDDLHKFIKSQSQLTDEEKTVGLELLFKENYFHYRIIASVKIVSVISSLIYSKFSDAEIIEENGIVKFPKTLIADFSLKRSNFFPIKTAFTPNNDPYITLSAILSKLEHFSEGIILQLVITPRSETWLEQFLRERFYFVIGTLNKIKLFLEEPFLERQLVDYTNEVKTKFTPSLFWANLRVLAYAENKEELQENFSLVLKALDKFNNGDINSLNRNHKTVDIFNIFIRRDLSKRRMLFNTNELAALFHFPDSSQNVSGVYKISAKNIEPPKDIPISNIFEEEKISSFGSTNFRSHKLPFGILRTDRNRHLYIIGKTGMGKSKLIELLALSDIHFKKGLCIIDPHGDLAAGILKYIPEERINDVIYFNPADPQYAIGFNPLECYSSEAKHQVVTGFIAIFKKLFASNWTNRLEHMLRFTVLALLETKNATVIDIVKLLTDTEFRHDVINQITDPVVKNFWTHEFASWNEKFDNEAIVPIINQVGQFISNDYIRNVVGQKKSAIDFYQAMNSGKIIIINIAKGKLGEENSSLLGSMMITKIQEAAMARVNLDENERKEFYLYVDEFQNFATESFNQILSEARKFNLSLTIAHQYIDQLSESIRKTVFGNIGSLVCFRVGAEDTRYLDKEFEPYITEDDLINLDVRSAYVKLSISGKTSPPFSALTLDVPKVEHDLSQEIIRLNHQSFGVKISDLKRQLQKDRGVMELVTNLDSTDDNSKNNFDFEEPLV